MASISPLLSSCRIRWPRPVFKVRRNWTLMRCHLPHWNPLPCSSPLVRVNVCQTEGLMGEIRKGGFLHVFDTVFFSPSMRVKMGGVGVCIGNRQLRVLLHVLNPVVPSSSPKSQCVSGVGLSPLRGSEGGVFLVGGSCLEVCCMLSTLHCWNIKWSSFQ